MATGTGQASIRIGEAIALALLLLPVAALPSKAGQARAILSVTAVVAPSCRIDRDATSVHRADIACSAGASVSSATVHRAGEQPLAAAAAILGEPGRSRTGIAFAAPVQPASGGEPQVAAEAGTRYLTITY